MDAKALAAQIRKDIRVATKTAGDPLEGLKVSVTTPCWGTIYVTVKGVDRAILQRPDTNDWLIGGWATETCLSMSDRLHELAAPALAAADGRHTFCMISFDGLSAPGPRYNRQYGHLTVVR